MKTAQLLAAVCIAAGAVGPAAAQEARTLRFLFIGNSYTYRNDLAGIVERLIEAGQPGTTVEYEKVIYGGRILRQHWEEFRTPTLLRLPTLTRSDVEAVIGEIREDQATAREQNTDQGRQWRRLGGAIRNHQRWLERVEEPAPQLDYVVLQSYRDTRGGLSSPYAEYARKFAGLARERGARPVLYATAPRFQNATALQAPPDLEPFLDEARFLAALGTELDALVVPVCLAIYHSQRERPDLPLRWRSDAHLNQACSYLTACAFYAALFDATPEGLPVNEVTDPKIPNRDAPDQDPDGGPRRVVFDDETRTHLQRCAWEAVQHLRRLQTELPL